MQNKTGGRNITAWFIVGFLVLLTAGVIIAGFISGTSGESGSSTFVATTAPAITSADWQKGPATSTVSLIEYGDFECPACGAYYPVVQQILSDYGSRIFFVFRNFPLYTVHPLASIGAQAAEAAGLEGGQAKYWAMNDLLYKNQATWAAATPDTVVAQFFNGYASSIGLNVSTFDTDINSAAVNTKIGNDVAGGNNAQINHTPTFFINLKQIQNPASYDEFKADLDAALASHTGSASGSSANSLGVSVSATGGSLSVTSTPVK